jgi:hypothetical protein
MCRSGSYTTLSVPTNHKKLSHVPDLSIAGNLRPSPHQSKARQFSVNMDQERKPVRFAPIQRKVLVTKAAILAKFHIDELAEVVLIQLEQIGQDGLVLRSRWCNFDIHASEKVERDG